MEKDLESKLYMEYFEGKEEVFELLYNKYKSKIQYFIFNIVKDYQKAEDITQEVFIYVFQNQSKKNCRFRNYLYLVAKSRAISYTNIEKRREEITEMYLENGYNNIEQDINEFIENEETKKEIMETINELDDKYKNAIYLTQIEELSYKEVSEILGESTHNIKNLVHRGKKELRKKLIDKKIYINQHILKMFAIIICAVTLISGVAFAKEIRIIIHNLTQNIFGTYNDGISTAIENDYISEIDMNYIKFDGVKIKLDSVLLDDYNLGIIYNLKITDNQYLEKLDISQIGFKNLLIMDENNNILHAEYEDINSFKEYCKENNLDAGKFGTGFSNGETIKKIIQKSNNNYFLVSDLITSPKFPNSKKLYISFDAVYFMNNKAFYCAGKVYKKDKIGEKEANMNDYVTVNEKWNFEIDLDEIAQKRKTIEYSTTYINDNDTIISNVILSMTNMKLEIITNSKKIDFEKLQNNNKETINVMDMIPFHEIYIETPNGDKFYEIGENGYDNLEDGKIRYYTTFNYTYFNKQDNIKLILPTNTGEAIVAELKMNK